MSLGTKLLELRENIGWTQGQLALKSKISRSYISLLENDQVKSPSASKLIKLANALQVSEDILFEAAGLKMKNPVTTEEEKQEFLEFLNGLEGISQEDKGYIERVVLSAYEKTDLKRQLGMLPN